MTAPSTSSTLWAEWRRGLKDLQNAVLNPFNGITQTHQELGTIANPTPQIVTQGVQGEQTFDQKLGEYATKPAPEQAKEMQRE